MASGRARRDPQKEKHWLGIVRRWELSGLSQLEFCRTEGIADSSFYSWRRELTKRGLVDKVSSKPNTAERKGISVKQPAFVPVEVKESPSGKGASVVHQLEIVTPGGYVVRIP